MYGPSLWFACATLNLIAGTFVPSAGIPAPGILPTTVSPTWKVPDCIVISVNFGVQYFVTATPSKNPYNCVSGLHLVTLNCMFLERIIMITSRLTVLSPKDSLSNCSVTTFLVPVLTWSWT